MAGGRDGELLLHLRRLHRSDTGEYDASSICADSGDSPRREAVCCQLGGEEFVGVLDEEAADDWGAVANRLVLLAW